MIWTWMIHVSPLPPSSIRLEKFVRRTLNKISVSMNRHYHQWEHVLADFDPECKPNAIANNNNNKNFNITDRRFHTHKVLTQNPWKPAPHQDSKNGHLICSFCSNTYFGYDVSKNVSSSRRLIPKSSKDQQEKTKQSFHSTFQKGTGLRGKCWFSKTLKRP